MVCYNYTDLVTKREVARNIQLIEQNYPVEDWGKKAGHCKECFENIEGIREHRNYQIVQVARKLFMAVSAIRLDTTQDEVYIDTHLLNLARHEDTKHSLDIVYNRCLEMMYGRLTGIQLVKEFLECAYRHHLRSDYSVEHSYLRSAKNVLYTLDPVEWLEMGNIGIDCVEKFREEMLTFLKEDNELQAIASNSRNNLTLPKKISRKFVSINGKKNNIKINRNLVENILERRKCIRNEMKKITTGVNINPCTVNSYLLSEITLMNNTIHRFKNLQDFLDINNDMTKSLQSIQTNMEKVIKHCQLMQIELINVREATVEDENRDIHIVNVEALNEHDTNVLFELSDEL